MKLKLKQKQKTKLKQKLIEQQLELIKLKELLAIISFIGVAAGLRSALQWLPSIEPLTFFAVLGGWLFGRKKGFLIGASSLYISNFFVFGGQGPWTLPQLFCFGVAGWLGGLVGKKLNFIKSIFVMLLATVFFELVMNAYSAIFFGGNLLLALVTALPFSLTHLVSNAVFALALPFFAQRLVREGFHEKEFITNAIAAIRNYGKQLFKRTKERA